MAPAAAETAANGAGGDGEVDFEGLLADILENPERVLDKDLTPEQILKLQRQLNPYAYVAGDAGDPGHQRAVALSYTNLREDYIRRFTMTGLVGFLFRMHDEWEPPPTSRRWISKAGARREAAAQAKVGPPFTPDELLQQAEGLAELARLAKDAEAGAAAAREAALLADADSSALGGEAPEAEKKELAARAEELLRAADAALARARGLHYGATFGMRRWGLECDARIDALEAVARQHPEVREELDRHPLRRPPPGQHEMPAEAAKGLVAGFLRSLFEFNPDAHVRSAHDAFVLGRAVRPKLVPGLGEVPHDEADPLRLPLSVVLAAAPVPEDPDDRAAVEALTLTPPAYNAAAYMLRHPPAAAALSRALEAPERFQRYLFPIAPGAPARAAAARVPPQDTFHRWQYYMEVNFEDLRTATDAIYHERPDLDLALVVYRGFEGAPAEVEKDFEKFYDQHQEEVMSDIRSIPMGGWTLLGDFKANRDKINFYNKHTDVLKRILDRHGEDKKIGQELMRNRVRQQKANNIAADGPDAPGLAEYASTNAGRSVAALGAQRILSREDRLRLERTKGNLRAAKELEVADQCQETIRSLTELAKERALRPDEERRFRDAQTDLVRAQEMLEVPEDSLAVDVWAPGADGVLGKTQFYTKAEAPEYLREHQARAAGEPPPPPPTPAEGRAAEGGGARAAAQRASNVGGDDRPLAVFASVFHEEALRAERARAAELAASAPP
jgi:hypothetical protein